MNYEIHTLKNGLRIVHKNIPGNISYCGFIVNAGTRDELSGEYGMAHFIEHMLFKGTAKRRSYHILNRMDAIGGELNAYTNKEETVIYSVFLKEYFERACELLSDLVFHSEFPQHEIEKEREVILDEINMYEDSPSELIYDEFENLVFNGSQLGHNILGDTDSLMSFDTAKSKSFVNRNYITENIVFFSLGSTRFDRVIRILEKYLSDLSQPDKKGKRIVPDKSEVKNQVLEKNTSQAHIMIGGRAYSFDHPKRKALTLLNNILGGPAMNSRLNMSLREKSGYVYNVESGITSYSDVGLFSVYFGTDKHDVKKCIGLVNKELTKLKNTKLSSSQLFAAKKQLIGQIAVSSDNHENLALTLAKSISRYNHFDSLEEMICKIESISAEDLMEVANEIFDDNNLSYLQII